MLHGLGSPPRARVKSVKVRLYITVSNVRRYRGGEKKPFVHLNVRLKRCIFLKQVSRSANDATSISESALHGAQPRQKCVSALCNRRQAARACAPAGARTGKRDVSRECKVAGRAEMLGRSDTGGGGLTERF